MIRGCFTNIFAGIGCLTVLIVVGAAAWYFRADISEAYRSMVERPVETDSLQMVRGFPSERALESALNKERAIGRRGGPERITLSADEMASIIEDRLTLDAKAALDSVTVVLSRDRLALEASLRTDAFGRDLLGPLRGMIDPTEPIRVSGPGEITAPGIIGWDIDEFQVALFPFPGPAIPVLVERLTGAAGGVVMFAVPVEVGSLEIGSDGVTFYRRAN